MGIKGSKRTGNLQVEHSVTNETNLYINLHYVYVFESKTRLTC